MKVLDAVLRAVDANPKNENLQAMGHFFRSVVFGCLSSYRPPPFGSLLMEANKNNLLLVSLRRQPWASFGTLDASARSGPSGCNKEEPFRRCVCPLAPNNISLPFPFVSCGKRVVFRRNGAVPSYLLNEK